MTQTEHELVERLAAAQASADSAGKCLTAAQSLYETAMKPVRELRNQLDQLRIQNMRQSGAYDWEQLLQYRSDSHWWEAMKQAFRETFPNNCVTTGTFFPETDQYAITLNLSEYTADKLDSIYESVAPIIRIIKPVTFERVRQNNSNLYNAATSTLTGKCINIRWESVDARYFIFGDEGKWVLLRKSYDTYEVEGRFETFRQFLDYAQTRFLNQR